MRGWDPEQIREVLNAHATTLLKPETDDARAAYQGFLRESKFQIYQAWYLGPEPGENEVLGYTIQRHIARGAFGRVYEAIAPTGERVAIKVLLEDLRQDPFALFSFRRGVQSMRILSERAVAGMVRYREASEIPAFVVMDFVEGPNLATAREAGHIDSWRIILRIACELAAVVRRAHALPERVLHRDLRPENVMLKDYYTAGEDWQVVVLDFDLSWHRDANERSVLHTTSAGYLAPEQMRRTPGVSTRSALVDSFGLGMTLLFLCTGEDPDPDEHRQVQWVDSVRAAAEAVPATGWACVPTRFARLILQATSDQQAERWDLATIENELSRLRTAVDEPNKVRSTEFLTEEVAAQTPAFHGYSWDADALRASKVQPTGLEYSLTADLQNERIILAISWAATGVEDRKGVRKYLSTGSKKAEDQLRAAGWKKVMVDAAGLSVAVEAQYEVASLRASDVQRRAETVGSRLDKAIDNLRF
jgi:serine/threonine protein kinase